MMQPIKSDPHSLTSPELFLRHEADRDSPDIFAVNFIRSRSFGATHRRLIIFVMLGYFVAQGLILIALVLWGLGFRDEAVRYNRNFQMAFPSISSSEDYSEQLNQLTRRAEASLAGLKEAIAIEKDKFRVAGKLAGIVRTLPMRTWVTSVRFDAAERTLSVEAVFLVDEKAPDQEPMKEWTEALKKDPGFGAGLKKIELVRSTQAQKGDAEILVFEIKAGW
jgi:Tfp pilus assembly protein PilN